MNLNPITPIAGVSPELTRVLNDRFREIEAGVNTARRISETVQPVRPVGPWHRTLLLQDTTVGDDIAPHVPPWGPSAQHKLVLLRVVLRKTISADLTVRIKTKFDDGAQTKTIGTFNIPAAQAKDSIIDFDRFDWDTVPHNSTFVWDVVASDGQIDKNGVASYTIEWQP